LTTAQQDSLERVQTKIAFLEQAMNELSDVVFRQHKDIQALEAQLRALKERLSGVAPDDARTPEQERPPHY
jgi:SlyX protein